MKTCTNCWCANDDEAECCRECGTKFVVWKGLEPLSSSQQDDAKFNCPIPTSTKLRFWFGAWGFVILASLAVNPSYLLAAPCFPVGLFALFPNGIENVFWGWGTGAFVLGWVLYAVLSAIMFKAKKKSVFLIIYIIFCILLLLNVGGCQRVLEDVSHIE